jgi:hypothetical protein
MTPSVIDLLRRLRGLFLSTHGRKYRAPEAFSTDNTSAHSILSPPSPSIHICNGLLSCSSSHRSIPHRVRVLPLCLAMALEHSPAQPFRDASKVKPVRAQMRPEQLPTAPRTPRTARGGGRSRRDAEDLAGGVTAGQMVVLQRIPSSSCSGSTVSCRCRRHQEKTSSATSLPATSPTSISRATAAPWSGLGAKKPHPRAEVEESRAGSDAPRRCETTSSTTRPCASPRPRGTTRRRRLARRRTGRR